MPFSGATIAETLERISVAHYTPPSKVASDVPAALDAFFARCFALDREDRFPNAAVMAQAFREALATMEESAPARRSAPSALPSRYLRTLPAERTDATRSHALRSFGQATAAFLARTFAGPLARPTREPRRASFVVRNADGLLAFFVTIILAMTTLTLWVWAR
jgi:hypothetical protein